MDINSTERFSNRVEDYIRYRPGYPASVLPYLKDRFDLTTDKMVADIGAGTGISTALFLEAGYRVWAVEPNKEMRQKSVELLNRYTGFVSVDGRAENTTLPDNSTDAIVAFQAFHWFDAGGSKAEFQRILKAGGIVVLIWNERKSVTAFEKEYDGLIVKHGKDYQKVDHRNIRDKDIESFFYPKVCELTIFNNHQIFDFGGLKGRLSSSSYMPLKNETGYTDMISDLQKLFEKYEKDDLIRINYDTKVYAGRFK